MIFSVISNLLLHCIALYVFRQLTLKDESKVYLHPFPCHQGLLWPMGWVNHVLPLRFGHCIVFFSKLMNFVCFSELLTSVPPGYWVEYSYIKKCPLAKNPEPSSSISTRASSVIFAVLSCSDSPITCWSVGLINRSWHMIFRTLAVKSHIWLWRRLIKLLSCMKERRPWWNRPDIHRLLEVVVVAIHTVAAAGPKSSSCWWCSLPLLWEQWWPKCMHPTIGLFHLTVAVHRAYDYRVLAKLSYGGLAYFFVYYSYSPLSSCRVVDLLLVFAQ